MMIWDSVCLIKHRIQLSQNLFSSYFFPVFVLLECRTQLSGIAQFLFLF
ncbi:hypothetical protein CUMW_289850 [Citrus unshiu]|uniref:Uncharacterized protein n=1 Tax=Citrus unshiu TaxID=55188 RepID=A0A2H5QY37_CITUN|nr:hypothetical protein CUMW_289850 [Citrus unshiu]